MLGGLLLAGVGFVGAYLGAAFGLLVAAGLLLLVPIPGRTSKHSTTPWWG